MFTNLVLITVFLLDYKEPNVLKNNLLMNNFNMSSLSHMLSILPESRECSRFYLHIIEL